MTFGLTKAESRALFDLQHRLMMIEFERLTDEKSRNDMEKWIKNWRKPLYKKFFGLLQDTPPNTDDKVVAGLLKILPMEKRELICCEALDFVPQYKVLARDSKVEPEKKDRV